MLLIEVDHDLFDRFEQRAVGTALEQNLGTRDRKLKAFAAHGLDEDAKLKLAAAGDLHGIALLGFGDTKRHVTFGFAQQPVTDHPPRHLGSFGAGKGRIVDPEGHRQRGWVDRLGGKRCCNLRRANRMGDGRVGKACERNDVACGGFFEADTLEPAKGQHLGHAALLDEIASMVEHLHLLVRG